MWILLSAFLFIVVSAQAVPRKANREVPFVNGVNAMSVNDMNAFNLVNDDETVTIERNLTKGQWVTLVLPYNVQDINNFNGIKCEALEYCDLDVVSGDNNTCNVTLHFETVTSMWAGYPYLFRAVEFPDGGERGTLTVYKGPKSEAPNEDDIITRTIVTNGISVLTKGTFEGYTLDVANNPSDYIFFYFGYDPQAEVPYNFYVVDNGTVYIQPSLCYFKMWSETNANNFNLFFDQETTKINEVNIVVDKNDKKVDNNEEKVYNLNGQQVTGDLSKGIYIVNGKKILVK